MKKIKILQFPIANSKGGVTQYVLNNWKHINKNNFQFDFATMNKEIDFEDELVKEGCKIHHISSYAEDDEDVFIKEINNILLNDYDVIHLHTSYWKSFLFEELARKKKVPKIIVHAHNSMVLNENEEERKQAIIHHNLLKKQFTMDFATDFLACSQVAAKWLFGEQIPKEKIQIMKNAIDLDKYQFNKVLRENYRKKLGLNNSFVIGHVGRFVYQKNHDFLIDVFIEVKKKIKNSKLLLVGTGLLKETIQKKVIANNLQEDVLFLGKRNDVDGLMQAMDIFCLPSRFEGLGMVLIEAQGIGLKSIISECIPPEAEVTKDVIRIPLDINLWTKAVLNSANGYARINNKDLLIKAGYQIENQVKQIEQLYCKGITHKGDK